MGFGTGFGSPSGGGGGGTPWAMLTDPGDNGNISTTTSGVMWLGAGASRSLNVPTALGQTLILVKTTSTGDGSIIIQSEQNLDGNGTATVELKTANSFVTLQSIQTADDPITYEWRITAPNADFITSGTLDDDILSAHIPKTTGIEGPMMLSAAITSAPISEFQDVCWSPTLTLFVAVGGDLTQIATSYDGMTWTPRTSPNVNPWNSVCWSPALNLFCAVGTRVAAVPAVITSPDGINWTEQTEAANAIGWLDICWSPQLNIFCAVSGYNANRVMTSPDGIVWTPQTSFDSVWTCICWSSDLNLFVAFANNGPDSKGMSSPDGVNWTELTLPLNEASFVDVCYSNMLGRFIAISDTTPEQVYSTDGVNWVLGAITGLGAWNGISGDNPSVVVAVSGDGVIASTTNGNDWTVTEVPTSPALWAVVWSPTRQKFVAIANADKDSSVSHVLTYGFEIIGQKLPILDASLITNVFYPEDYGTGSDQASVEAAVTAAAASPSSVGTVLLGRSGSNIILTTQLNLPGGVCLKGIAPWTTIQSTVTGGPAITLNQDSRLIDLTLNCQYTATGSGIYVGNPGAVVRNVMILNVAEVGITLIGVSGQSTNLIFKDVSVVNANVGIIVSGCDTLVHMSNLTFINVAQEAINIASSSRVMIDQIMLQAVNVNDVNTAGNDAAIIIDSSHRTVLTGIMVHQSAGYPAYLVSDNGNTGFYVEAMFPDTGMAKSIGTVSPGSVIRNVLDSEIDALIADPGNGNPITVRTGICVLTGAGSESRTLPAPTRAGILITLNLGNGAGPVSVYSGTTIDQLNHDLMVFDAEGETVTLRSTMRGAATYVWSVVGVDGTTLTNT